jgi:hypothetical protein
MIWIALPIAVILGIFLGLRFAKRKIKAEDNVLQKEAINFIHGKRNNSFNFEGRKINADTFVLRNDQNQDEEITFKDGQIVKRPTEVSTQKSVAELPKNESEI